jgi:hypothetical protein
MPYKQVLKAKFTSNISKHTDKLRIFLSASEIFTEGKTLRQSLTQISPMSISAEDISLLNENVWLQFEIQENK